MRMPPALLAGAAGIWLFYVQHQFEDAYWESGERLELRRRRAARQLVPEAAEGAAVLHRQHRPAPRPPPQRAHPELQPPARARREPDLPRRARRCRSGTACSAVRLKLWDEDQRRLVTFAQARQSRYVSGSRRRGTGPAARSRRTPGRAGTPRQPQPLEHGQVVRVGCPRPVRPASSTAAGRTRAAGSMKLS